ncbi:RNA helicase [Gregarina niphandrodes]|uniref:RNA helicase n=1 Tax=Gregarina niphandrodes TaxID=110365 RepID=A0A023BCG6_GRENI|nr:RNA helicase [Gregarina niphandrodes]EZG82237.1 RNA helicase [Gregarina niphandrodes]|eukprot:XP_011129018.1 RNA helicase [Gregarina niphandrodes]
MEEGELPENTGPAAHALPGRTFVPRPRRAALTEPAPVKSVIPSHLLSKTAIDSEEDDDDVVTINSSRLGPKGGSPAAAIGPAAVDAPASRERTARTDAPGKTTPTRAGIGAGTRADRDSSAGGSGSEGRRPDGRWVVDGGRLEGARPDGGRVEGGRRGLGYKTVMEARENADGVRFLTKKEREALKAYEAAAEREKAEESAAAALRKQREFLSQATRESNREPGGWEPRDWWSAEAEGRSGEPWRESRKRGLSETASDSGHMGPSESPDPKLSPGENRRLSAEETSAAATSGVRASVVAGDLGRSPAPELPRSHEQELAQLRNQYLGIAKDRRKLQKPSEKFRNVFQFEWDYKDDTTRGDYNPVYTERYTPQLLFGRGYRAGMDVREQRKQNRFYDSLASRRAELLSRGQVDEDELDLGRLSVTQLVALDSGGLGIGGLGTGVGGQVLGLRSGAGRRSLELSGNYSDDTSDGGLSEEVGFSSVDKKPLGQMTERDWRIFREDHSIAIKGTHVPPPPARSWAEAQLPREIMRAVERAGYVCPTPIQMQAIPIALGLHDMIGIAETGSGKTAAFIIPMITYVNRLPRLDEELAQRGPYGLVLAPARELALQIREEAVKFGAELGIKSVCVLGGKNAEEQAYRLRQGAEIVIGTPGRLRDCLDRAYTVLSQCNYIVLDEADRMIDCGFEQTVNWILDQIPSSKPQNWSEEAKQEIMRQAGYREIRITQMFSATMPPVLEKLAKMYLCKPCVIQIGTPGEGKRSIVQSVEFVHDLKKGNRLVEVVRQHRGRIIVFVNLKKSADSVSRLLHQHGFRAVALHGGKSQDVREASLESFRNGDMDVLVATDVAGRGIDVDDVQLVVNYDMPAEIETYTHRIGRTGRAGKEGKAVSFLTEDDARIFYDLKNQLLATDNAVPKTLNDHPQSNVKPNPESNQQHTQRKLLLNTSGLTANLPATLANLAPALITD